MTTLQRRIGAIAAMTVGLSAMIGGGVFFVWAPAAGAAGPLLLVGLVIAAVVATLNALTTAQLAMAAPVAGGAYTYGRINIGPAWGFAAGVLFLVGKTASAAAIAVILGGYLAPDAARPVAVAAIVALATVNAFGIRSTAAVGTAVVIVVVGTLVAVIVGTLLASAGLPHPVGDPVSAPGAYGVLQAAGLLFFAFAGYARIATLAEEVREPRRTLPRAILGALGATLVLYAALALVLLAVLGPARLAAAASPIAELAELAFGEGPWTVVVAAVATIAGLGALIGVLAGLSRTALAMARDGELPRFLARVSPRTHAPLAAELAIAAVAIVGAVFLDPAVLVGFSACTVLGYYAIAQLAGWRQPAAQRWLPRWIQLAGALGCLMLAVTLQWPVVVAAAAVLVLAMTARALMPRRAPAG